MICGELWAVPNFSSGITAAFLQQNDIIHLPGFGSMQAPRIGGLVPTRVAWFLPKNMPQMLWCAYGHDLDTSFLKKSLKAGSEKSATAKYKLIEEELLLKF